MILYLYLLIVCSALGSGIILWRMYVNNRAYWQWRRDEMHQRHAREQAELRRWERACRRTGVLR